ncbi:MAG: hypothetical protein IJ156_08560 [Bacteroidales bacterium]|nr:hypothetical protein [Bacteroidales bacterium]
MKEAKRHGFISFWLWLCAIANGIMSIIYFLLLFSSKGLWSGTPEPIWLRLSWLFSSLITLLGFVMLLEWRKTGFYVVLGVQSIGLAIVLFASVFSNVGTTFPAIISTVAGIAILYGVLNLRHDGVPYWDAMDRVIRIDNRE